MISTNRLRRIGWLAALLPGMGIAAFSFIDRASGLPLAPEKAAIAYELTPRWTGTPHLLVTMHFAVAPDADAVEVQMPVWSPGDYHVQNFARFVEDFHAWANVPDDAHPLVFTHPDANTWHITTGGAQTVTLTYALPQTPMGFFSQNIQLQTNQVFVNGPAAYLYLTGHKTSPATLTFHLPSDWQVEMPLRAVASEAKQTVTFSSPDYDTLADSPLVAAPKNALKTLDFTFKGKPHRAVFFGAGVAGLEKPETFTSVLTAIVKAESKIMGGVPYERYEWFFDVGGRGGGLEHLNSSRLSLWNTKQPKSMASFIAHEFFHLWNIKRIRPRVLGPFDYITPPQTRNLWFAEGVTDYYADVAVRRAGLTTEAEFFAHWREAIKENLALKARREVSADDSSLRVWEAGNSSGYGISYYEKGALVGLCLDLKIRSVTNGSRSLDDVMRTLLKRYGLPKPGYDEDDLRSVINEVAGIDLTEFYNLLVRSTQEMPFAECLGYAGLDSDLDPLPNATRAQIVLRRNWVKQDAASDSGASAENRE